MCGKLYLIIVFLIKICYWVKRFLSIKIIWKQTIITQRFLSKNPPLMSSSSETEEYWLVRLLLRSAVLLLSEGTRYAPPLKSGFWPIWATRTGCCPPKDPGKFPTDFATGIGFGFIWRRFNGSFLFWITWGSWVCSEELLFAVPFTTFSAESKNGLSWGLNWMTLLTALL